MTSLQQYVNRELPDVQAGFRKGRGSRDQIASIRWIIEKAREFQKNIYFIDYGETFDCVCGSQQTGKFFKRWEYQTTLPGSWENCMQVKKQQLELDVKQQTGSRLGKEYTRATLRSLQSEETLPAASEVWGSQLEVELCAWIEDSAALLQLSDIIDGNKTSHVWGEIHQIETKIMNCTGFFVIAVI